MAVPFESALSASSFAPGRSIPAFFVSYGIALATWAAVAYQTANMAWGGIVLLLVVAAFMAFTVVHTLWFRNTVKDLERVRRDFIFCAGLFLVTSVFTAWLWLWPAAHNTGWLITTGVAVLQTLPFFLASARH